MIQIFLRHSGIEQIPTNAPVPRSSVSSTCAIASAGDALSRRRSSRSFSSPASSTHSCQSGLMFSALSP